MKPSIPKWVIIAFVVLSSIGFLDATYLTINHFQNTIPPCSLTEGCEKVLTSSYATLSIIPVALMGAIYYLVILCSTIAYADKKYRWAELVILFLPTAGFLGSVFFVFLQIFIIKSICLYCMISATVSTLLFLITLTQIQRSKIVKP